MEIPNPADLARIAAEMELPVEQVSVAVALLQEDNTIPFITRYRRDETGGMDEPQLRRIQQRIQQLSSLRERKASILKSIQAQEELSDALRQRIESCFSAKLLEDLYLPYKQKKTSWTQQARDLGLQPLAEAVLLEGLSADDFENEVKLSTDLDGQPLDRDLVLRGVRSLIGEAFSENIELRSRLRRAGWKLADLRSLRMPPADPASPPNSPDTTSAAPPVESANTVDAEVEESAPKAEGDQLDNEENNPPSTDNPPPATTADAVEDQSESDATSSDPAEPSSPTSVQQQASELPAETSSPSKRKRKRKKKRREEERFKDYFDYTEAVRTIPPHRVLAVNRGEKEKKLKVRIQLPEQKLWEIVCVSVIPATHPQHDLLMEAGRETLTRSLIPALEREIRRELTEKAEEHAIEVFTTNLRSLLLQPPIQGYRVLALDPGFKTGCKAAVLDALGNFVASTVISIVGNKQKRENSIQKLSDLIREHSVNLIAIGNGTGCRETELLIARLIGGPLAELKLKYVIVNEAGASIYSTSEIGSEEFPEVDPTIRSAISIGRRVLDPLSELVKIEPAHIGVGLYQHDVKSRHLEESLDAVVESCVNFVGVDVNTASPALLSYVAGLNQATARKIYEYRQQNGPFASREVLKQVSGVGQATYVQCAGFLRINGGDQPLDATAIHPESYAVAQSILDQIACSLTELKWLGRDQSHEQDASNQLTEKLQTLDVDQLADQLSVGRLRMRDIVDVLCRPGRDPRDSVPPPVFRSGVLDIEDLSIGMHLRGQVLNVVDFGIFVDIGLGESGLVHISNLSTGYIRDPHQFYSVGDVLDVWVETIDKKMKRVSLTAIDPESTKQSPPAGKRSQHSKKSDSDNGGDRQRPRRRKPSSQKTRPKQNKTTNGKTGDRPKRHSQAAKRNKPVAPISDEMARGQEPLRSFSDLMQFVSLKKDDQRKSPPPGQN